MRGRDVGCGSLWRSSVAGQACWTDASRSSPRSARRLREEGPGEGFPRAQCDAIRRARNVRQTPPPPGFLGEVGEFYEPGGGAGRQRSASRSALQFSPSPRGTRGEGPGGGGDSACALPNQALGEAMCARSRGGPPPSPESPGRPAGSSHPAAPSHTLASLSAGFAVHLQPWWQMRFRPPRRSTIPTPPRPGRVAVCCGAAHPRRAHVPKRDSGSGQ
jgi:hypothetical protein